VKLFVLVLLLVFSSAIAVSVLGFEFYNQMQIPNTDIERHSPNPVLLSGNEVPSPSNWIEEEQITVLKDRVVIYIDNPTWARFADTNSMDPLLDIGSHGVEIKPDSPEQIQIGDVIAYERDDFDGVVVHRVVDIGQDNDGYYFITKGDNNNVSDGIKVRFPQIKGVLVAVIW
jgi:signal peptidase I